MAAHLSPARSLVVVLIATTSVLVAGCGSGGTAGLTTTAIVRLPSGFHAARPTDEATLTRPTAKPRAALTESATLRLEGAHRRAEAARAATTAQAAAGSFVCQIDMGTESPD